MYMLYSRFISSADMGYPEKIKYTVGRMHSDLTHVATSPIKFARPEGRSKEQLAAGLHYKVYEPAGIAMDDGSLILSVPVELWERPTRPRVEMLLMRFDPRGDRTWERKFTNTFYKYGKPPTVGFFRSVVMMDQFRTIDKSKFRMISGFKRKDSVCYLYNTTLPQDALMMTCVALDGTLTTRVILANTDFKVLPGQISDQANALIVPRRYGNDVQLGSIDLW